MLYFFLDIPGILIGVSVSYFIASIPHLQKYKIKSFSGLKKYYKVIIHNFAIDSSRNLSIMVDKLLIVYLFSYTIVGIYQFSLQIVIVLAALPGILGAYLISDCGQCRYGGLSVGLCTAS